MKNILIAFSIFASVMSCRTVSEKNVSQIKSSADCSEGGPLARLNPGGLFASKALYLTQKDIPSGIVHPAMLENKKSSASQTFRFYTPAQSGGGVKAAMVELAKRARSLPVSEIKGAGSSELVLSGRDRRFNVFSGDADLLDGVRKIRVDVPPGSSAAVIIHGSEVRLSGLDVSGEVTPESLLLITPDAKALSVVGGTFSGTIIAPDANITLESPFSGSVFGLTIHASKVISGNLYTGCAPAPALSAVAAVVDDSPHADDHGQRYVATPKTSCSERIFGSGFDFNLFAHGDVIQSSTDVQGRVFVGGNGQWTDFSAGDLLAPDASRPDIVANGSVTFTRGATVNGGIIWGTSGALSQVFSLGIQAKGSSGVDADQVFAKLEKLSSELAAKSSKDESLTDLGGGAFEIKLKGLDPKYNFFRITADKFKTVRVFSLEAPAQSTAILTITGANAEISNFDMKLIGISRDHVIVNLPDATTLKVSKIGVEGTLLAPKAQLTFDGLITGQVFVKSLTGGGQINLAPFSGCPSEEPHPSPGPSPTPAPGPSPHPVPNPLPPPPTCGPTQMGKSPSQMNCKK